jgi:hypothetical protein
MKARNTTSSFSKREKMRRNPFKRRKQALDLVSLLVEFAIIIPGFAPIRFGGNDRNHVQLQHQLPGFIAFVGPVHHQRNFDRHRSQFQQQLSAHRSIVRLSRRQAENYCRSSIRGNQMNFGVPSASRFPNGLRSVFFKAPVPSGCTFTEVESKLKASILRRRICSCCNLANT